MDPLLVGLADSSAGGEEGRLRLYQAIIDKGLSADDKDGSSTARAFQNRRDVILPVLVKDSRQDSCVQLVALELLGHLCAMASSWEPPAFRPIQASLLWGAVAKVLDNEASARIVRVLALFAISKQTMDSRLVEPSVEQLAPGVARSMGHESTVVRQASARAVHTLLGAAPGAMALCARCTAVANSEEDNCCWLQGLLRLCFDDAVGVRESALASAERAVAVCNFRGNAGVSARVLKELGDGSLDRALRRLLLGNAEPRSRPALSPPPAAELPAKGNTEHPSSSSATSSADLTPGRAKGQLVKQALRAWAVYLSLADLDSLLLRSDGDVKRLVDVGTTMFTWLSTNGGDKRDAVRIQAVEAWEMFTTSMMAQCSLDPIQTQARKVAYIFLKVLAKRITKENAPAVRGEAMSAIAGLAASFPSPLFRHLWEPRGGKEKLRLAEVLQAVAEADKSVEARYYCAQLLANLLPCFRLQGVAGSHPSLRESGVDLAKALPHLLLTLEGLMEGKGQCSATPVPEEAVSTMDAISPTPLLSSSGQTGGSSAASRLEVLPMGDLVANAWCGLAFWAMECAASPPVATVAASPAADEPTPENKDEDGGGSGKGKGRAKSAAGSGGGDSTGTSAAPLEPNQVSATSSEGGRPLLVLLRWLLGGTAACLDGSGREAATDDEPVAGRSGAAEEVGPAPATPVVASTENLARWKVSLLGRLIRRLSRRRALSGMRTAPPGTDDSGAKGNLESAEPTQQAWLDAPVDVSSLHAGGGSRCPQCALTGDAIRDAVLRESGKMDDGGDADRNDRTPAGEQDREMHRAKSPPPRFPLWLVLLERVLRGRCRCDKHDDPASLVPQDLLAEALALSPSGWSARFLESLYRGVFSEIERGDHGTGATWPEERKIRGSRGSARGVLSAKRSQEELCSGLNVLGHAWRAEASRVLLGWKSRRLRPDPSPPSSPGGVMDTGLDGSVIAAGLPRNGSAAGAASAQQKSSDELRQDTGSTLLLLLRIVSSLLSLSSPPSGAACNRSREGETEATGVVGDAACAPGETTAAAAHDREQGGAREGEGVAEAQVSSLTTLEEGEAQGWSQDGRRVAAARAMLGAESAGLWGEIFEARRNSQTHAAGFTRLVKHLAKACGSCALSAEEPEEADVGSRVSGANAEGNSSAAAWGLGFSQTQPQQQQQQDKKSASESGQPAQAPAPAAAAAAALNTLAPPPPFFSLPALAAAALALLRAAPNERKLRQRAWKAGLATLAWTLTSSIENVTVLPQPPLLPQPAPASSAPATAGEEVATAEICRCLRAVRSVLATAAGAAVDSTGVNWSSGTAFPLDEASLSPVCQLLAASVGRSCAASAAPAAAQGARPGDVVGAGEEPREACAAVAVVAVPAVRSEVLALVVCVLSAVRSFRPEVLEKSPGLLLALSPVLEAVLDLPASSDAKAVQSSLLDAWNATFGSLNLKPPSAPSGAAGDGREAWQGAFRPSLLRRLSELSRREEVRLPSGITITLPTLGGSSGAAATAPAPAVAAAEAGPAGRQDDRAHGQKASALGGEAGEGEAPARCSAAVGDLRGVAAGTERDPTPPEFAGGGGVAGVLSAEGSRRSFLRTVVNSSPPSRASATPEKRSASPTPRAGGAAGSGGSADKFVRVVGSGRGSASRTPTRRAAVTTHTSLDGSQAMNPWEGGSQLPDTDPDSAPDLALEEDEGLAAPPPPKNGLPPPWTPPSEHGANSTSTASTTSPEATGGFPSKRALEEAESETVDPNKATTPPRGAAAAAAAVRGGAEMPSPSSTASGRRVRHKTAAGSGGGNAVESSDACESEDNGVGKGVSAGTAAAAAAAAAAKEAQEALTHATMLAISRAEAEQRRLQAETGCEDGDTSERTPSSRATSMGQDVGVDTLLQDVRSLAQRVEAARSALSPEQLQEVGSLLQKMVRG